MTNTTILDSLQRPGVDRILDVLRRRQRRQVLLLMRQGAVDHETDVMMRGSQDEEDVALELRHTHLPKLDEAGYIEWDPETGTISKGPRFEEVKPILDLLEKHADELPPDWP